MADAERRLGERVTTLRKLRGLTQAALAEAIGVSTETVSRLERGSAIPSLARIEEIAQALRVELRDLFDFGGDDSPEKQALEELVNILRGGDPRLIQAVKELASLLLQHWPPVVTLGQPLNEPTRQRKRPARRRARRRQRP